MEKLYKIINNDDSFKNKSSGKILIFTRSKGHAQSTFDYLKERNLNCVLHHSKLTKEERQKNLMSFSNNEGIIMISTDGNKYLNCLKFNLSKKEHQEVWIYQT